VFRLGIGLVATVALVASAAAATPTPNAPASGAPMATGTMYDGNNLAPPALSEGRKVAGSDVGRGGEPNQGREASGGQGQGAAAPAATMGPTTGMRQGGGN